MKILILDLLYIGCPVSFSLRSRSVNKYYRPLAQLTSLEMPQMPQIPSSFSLSSLFGPVYLFLQLLLCLARGRGGGWITPRIPPESSVPPNSFSSYAAEPDIRFKKFLNIRPKPNIWPNTKYSDKKLNFWEFCRIFSHPIMLFLIK